MAEVPFLAIALSCFFGTGVAHASPEAADTVQRSVFWGDTHVHSSYSLDANLFGNLQLGPEAAFRFARGEAIETGGGLMAKLDRPLDFLVVADHAEFLGVLAMLRSRHPLATNTTLRQSIVALLADNAALDQERVGRLYELLYQSALGTDNSVRRFVWDDVVDTAERMNEPGTFTTFAGYEWSSTPDGNNLHRNVIFRDGPDKTKRILPFSYLHSEKPERLWAYLAAYEDEVGGQAFAIPHNSNLSNGQMFSVEDSWGKPIDAAYASTRARFEPIIEVTQMKGDSEAHPFLSPDDEFADFENWDKTNLFGLARTERSMLQFNYARGALKNGLRLQRKVGINPFKFGLIGSTDSHTSLSTADDDNYWGKTSPMLPGSERMTGTFISYSPDPSLSTLNWELAASGIVAVWAKANTRDAIFDALRRKETYATTGPRISVRFFGGYGFDTEDASSSDLAGVGYAKGVTMGGDLPEPPILPAAGEEERAPKPAAPTFLIAAAKDPSGANLDRIQIVKGWLGVEGEVEERVYDAVLAKARSKGATQLVTSWSDPDFDPTTLAFYYARVLQVKTPRWTAYDAKRFDRSIPPGARVEHQERAYTSPIWYTPGRDEPEPKRNPGSGDEPRISSPAEFQDGNGAVAIRADVEWN